MTEHGSLSEDDWIALAPVAGGIGRWMWPVDSERCRVDETLRRITGLSDRDESMPVAEFLSHIHASDRPIVTMAVNESFETGEPYQAEFRFQRPDGRLIWLTGSGKMVDLADGRRALVGVNYEITALRTEQERAALVAREMGHRVKNILAMVSSIYRTSARSAEDTDTLSEAFLGRLNALSGLNDLILQTGSENATLDAIIKQVLKPVADRNVTQSVADFTVNGTAAQTIVLVLNELMTNAVKYGGFADADGKVALSFEVDEEIFRLVWDETASYVVEAPTKSDGFGMKVLNSMTAATFKGRPQMKWRPTGLLFQCEWPTDEMAATASSEA